MNYLLPCALLVASATAIADSGYLEVGYSSGAEIECEQPTMVSVPESGKIALSLEKDSGLRLGIKRGRDYPCSGESIYRRDYFAPFIGIHKIWYESQHFNISSAGDFLLGSTFFDANNSNESAKGFATIEIVPIRLQATLGNAHARWALFDLFDFATQVHIGYQF